MSRSVTRSPIAATALVVAFVIGVPIALINRTSSSLLPLQQFDVALGVGIVAWMLISKSILDRTESVKLTPHPISPRWQAHTLVEQSIFGVGFTGRSDQTAPAELALANRIVPAADVPGDQLPAPRVVSLFGTDHDTDPSESDSPLKSIPVLHDPKPVANEVLATQERVVERGDTFWSRAARGGGDGRQWKLLQDLNLGRKVAPDVVLTAEHELRIGWTVLIPLTVREESESHEAF